MSEHNVTPGVVYWTPFEPAGLFRVTEIEPEHPICGVTAIGYYLGDHPHGYKDGTLGRYPVKELHGRQASIEDVRRALGLCPYCGERACRGCPSTDEIEAAAKHLREAHEAGKPIYSQGKYRMNQRPYGGIRVKSDAEERAWREEQAEILKAEYEGTDE